jgi:hypothetical protein
VSCSISSFSLFQETCVSPCRCIRRCHVAEIQFTPPSHGHMSARGQGHATRYPMQATKQGPHTRSKPTDTQRRPGPPFCWEILFTYGAGARGTKLASERQASVAVFGEGRERVYVYTRHATPCHCPVLHSSQLFFRIHLRSDTKSEEH